MKKLVILSVTLFFTSSLFSATILVPADQPSIQAGTNAGANGDSVLVADRIYIGSGSINSLCGDVNGDGLVGNVLDLTYMIEYFYRGGAPPPDIAAADMDGCPGVDVRDFTFIIDRIFRGGPPPCTGPINCTQGIDLGNPDSLKLVLTVPPVVGMNVPVIVECSVYVDSNSLSTIQFAWKWDNSFLQMDSAIGSAQLNAMEISPFFFLDNRLATTNASQIAICSGTSLITNFPPNNFGWRHLATYYMTASSWTGVSTLKIDTVEIPDLAATEYIFIPIGEQFYRPIWSGQIGGCTSTEDFDNDGIDDCSDNCPIDFNPTQADADSNGVGDACCCIGNRGDLNGDGTDANILDLTFAVDRIFRGGLPSGCPSEADINADGTPHNILDLTYLVDRIFRGGPIPPGC